MRGKGSIEIDRDPAISLGIDLRLLVEAVPVEVVWMEMCRRDFSRAEFCWTYRCLTMRQCRYYELSGENVQG